MNDPPIRVMALHALAYCERLFYLEEVEEIRMADAAVYAGRLLHEQVAPDDADGRFISVDLSSDSLGLTGRADCVRYADGMMLVYEHKRGRHRPLGKEADAWESDKLQVAAYTMMLAESLGRDIPEARVRYHATNRTVRVPINQDLRCRVHQAILRARELRGATSRPPISDNENLCIRCSLAPVCLPEEVRQANDPRFEPLRLFPPAPERQTIHVLSGARIGRSGDALVVQDEGDRHLFPAQDVGDILVHGFAQISTQAVRLCSNRDIGVHWLTTNGRYIAGLSAGVGRVQQRVRQYEALTRPDVRIGLARRLVAAKCAGQLRYVLRCTRNSVELRRTIEPQLKDIRHALRQVGKVESVGALHGHEGNSARAYFDALKATFVLSVPEPLRYVRRSRRPPADRFNALLSFGYGILYQKVLTAILTVGLEPALGFYHTPRSAAHPLVLDVMELFRVIAWDIPLLGSINRGQWDVDSDFQVTRAAVWLSEAGRRKAVDLLEKRLQESWKHPVVGYSLSYARLIELEVRLLEKEWTGEPGLFARLRLR